jgi:hypothetical protein
MARTFPPERQRELDDLYAVAKVFAGLLDAESDLAPEQSLSAALARAYEKADLRGLRMAHADFIGGFLPAFSVAQRKELDRLLRAGPGVTLDSLEARQLERIAKVRAKGQIATEQQYYMLRERVELIWDDPERVEEFRALRAMLDAYEERATRRGARSAKPGE